MEHHSNIVPWQMLCEERGAVLKVVPISEDGELDFEAFKGLLSERTKIFSVVHVSNGLGTVNPVKELIAEAKRFGAITIVDGAQAVAHLPVDVVDLNCDFYAFSGHKVYAPMGIGVLYGKYELLDQMPPYQGGGDMIEVVTFEKTTYQKPPMKFEAGTPNVEGVIALKVALDFVKSVGFAAIAKHERELLDFAVAELDKIEGLSIVGRPKKRSGAISFVMNAAHPHDIGAILDECGVSIRTGHHCLQPLMKRLGIPATARASFAIYNSKDDVAKLVEAIKKVERIFSRNK